MKVVIALVLGMSAALGTSCAGDSTNADSGSEADRAIEANAQERAESMILVLTDLPEGWRASTAEKDTAVEEEFRRCVGSDYSGATIIGEADSKDFARGDTTEASSSATVFGSAEQAADAFAELAKKLESGSAEDCVRSSIEDMLAEEDVDAAVDDVEVGELNVAAPEGVDETRAWQVAITLTVPGLTTTGYIDLVALREGDSVADLDTSDLVRPFDEDLRNQLVQTLAGRLATTADE
jgi:hypothetical protein